MARKSFKEILSGGTGGGGTSGGTGVSKRAAFTQGVSSEGETGTTRKQRTQAKQIAADEKTSSLYDTLYEKVSGSLGTEYAQELSDMRKGYETQYSESEAAYGEETAKRTSEYQTQLGAMQTKYESDMKGAQDKWKSDFETLRGQADAYNDWATATLAERQAKMAAAQSDMTSQYNSAYAAFAADLAAQQAQQAADLAAQEEQWEAEIWDIQHPEYTGLLELQELADEGINIPITPEQFDEFLDQADEPYVAPYTEREMLAKLQAEGTNDPTILKLIEEFGITSADLRT